MDEARSYWKIIVLMILASLLIHIIVLWVWLFGILSELFTFKPSEPEQPPAKIVVKQEPLPELLAQQMPPQFMPTFAAQEVAEEDPNAPFQGEHNTRVQSMDPARKQDSMVGDMRGVTDKGMTYNNTPMIQGKEQSMPSPPTPPTPQKPTKEEPQKQQKPDEAKPTKTKEKPPEKPDKGKEEETLKAEATQPSKDKETTPEKKYAENAYPVLPPELKQQKQLAREKPAESEAKTQPQQQPRPPPQSFSQRRTDVQGGGPKADIQASQVRATPEGRYMSKLYRAIGSRWHLTIPQHMGTMSPGMVEITFFLRANGVVEDVRVTRAIGGGDLFIAICKGSILDSAPFEVFPDDMKRQYGRGKEVSISFTLE